MVSTLDYFIDRQQYHRWQLGAISPFLDHWLGCCSNPGMDGIFPAAMAQASDAAVAGGCSSGGTGWIATRLRMKMLNQGMAGKGPANFGMAAQYTMEKGAIAHFPELIWV